MKSLFLSHPIDSETPGFGGAQEFSLTQNRSIENGDSSNKIEFTLSNHFGTHIDFPKHFIKGGKSFSDYSAKDFYFSQVGFIELPLSKNTLLTPEMISTGAIEKDCDFLLIRTGFEKYRKEKMYWQENPGLTPELADHLKKTYPKIRCVGFDFISASAFQHRQIGREAHKQLLGTELGPEIWILEDMALSQLSECPKSLWVAPLTIAQADGIQVTVIANF